MCKINIPMFTFQIINKKLFIYLIRQTNNRCKMIELILTLILSKTNFEEKPLGKIWVRSVVSNHQI